MFFNFYFWIFSDFVVRFGRYGDLGEGILLGRVVVEVLGDLRGYICFGVFGGNMIFFWEGLVGVWFCFGGLEGV